MPGPVCTLLPPETPHRPFSFPCSQILEFQHVRTTRSYQRLEISPSGEGLPPEPLRVSGAVSAASSEGSRTPTHARSTETESVRPSPSRRVSMRCGLPKPSITWPPNAPFRSVRSHDPFSPCPFADGRHLPSQRWPSSCWPMLPANKTKSSARICMSCCMSSPYA